MRRINIYIDDDLDRRAQLEARKRRISRAALIRAALIAELGPVNLTKARAMFVAR